MDHVNMIYFIFTHSIFESLSIFRLGLLRIVLPRTLNTYFLVKKKKMCVTYLGMELMDYRVYVCLDLIDSTTLVQSGL